MRLTRKHGRRASKKTTEFIAEEAVPLIAADLDLPEEANRLVVMDQLTSDTAVLLSDTSVDTLKPSRKSRVSHPEQEKSLSFHFPLLSERSP